MNPFLGAVEPLKGAHWQDDALCAQVDADMFFPPRGDNGLNAKAVCELCPVKVQCAQFAADNNEPYGVWGGITEYERRRRKRVNPPTHSPRCGTASGADRHYRHNEQVCLPCRTAVRQANRARNQARRAEKGRSA